MQFIQIQGILDKLLVSTFQRIQELLAYYYHYNYYYYWLLMSGKSLFPREETESNCLLDLDYHSVIKIFYDGYMFFFLRPTQKMHNMALYCYYNY